LRGFEKNSYIPIQNKKTANIFFNIKAFVIAAIIAPTKLPIIPPIIISNMILYFMFLLLKWYINAIIAVGIKEKRLTL